MKLKFIKFNIIYKLIGYLVIVSILPLLIFAVSSYDVVQETILDLTSGYSSQLVNNQRDYLQLQLQQVDNLASRIATIDKIGEVAARTDALNEMKRDAYDDLSTQAEIRQNLNLYSSLKGVASIDFYTAKGHRFYVGETLSEPEVNKHVRDTMYRTALASDGALQWLSVGNKLYPASDSEKLLTAYKIVWRYSSETQLSEPVGMLLINCSTSYLFDHFSKVDLGRGSYMVVTDADGRVVYAPDKKIVGQNMPESLANWLKSGNEKSALHIDNRDYLVSLATIKNQGWHLFGVIPQETLLAPMRRLTQLVGLLIVLSSIIILLASHLFRRNMVAPIQEISKGFRRIQEQKNDLVEHLPVPASRDEISELVVWFNAFVDAHKMRLQYEEELRESQYKFASIFQQAPIPLGLVRIENGQFVDVNDVWLAQFEFSREEIIGNTSFELNVWVDLNERQAMLDQIKQTQATRIEVRQRAKSGRILICILSGRPIKIHEERLFIFSAVDITRQRETEKEIQEINQQLESRVQSRTLKLQETNEELYEALESLKLTKSELVRSEKLAALGSLVAGIAHELNTPIGNSVTVASTLHDDTRDLRRSVKEGNLRRSAIETYFDIIEKGTELLLRNLGNAHDLIASFKQVAADQASNQRRSFDLKETIEGIMVTLVPMYKKTAFVMTSDLAPGIKMNSYPGPLGQVLTNLVTNALTHAFEERRQGTMRLTTRLIDETHAELVFSDDGLGIPTENLARVFDPFFTTKLGQGGSGLGLNIVYNIVTSVLGGTVQLESEVGVGTCFIITLPLTPVALEALTQQGL
ncbi:PAS domain S-box protein [Undibacterium jejuense]|uniref:histidine kinase n=1 Tax=Undibacterium jejuense TaxID=1344949 RepID=A0A923HKY9_9BURK|nr:ATP-binding protein [Undibacterium jejuense]MBC3861561.1 PAS domain S-box protein [Undibacterium jejuense]